MRSRSSTFRSKKHYHFTRTQQRYDLSTGDLLLPNPWSVQIGSGVHTGAGWLDGAHTISDVVGNSSRRWYDVHPCTHTKTKVRWDKPYSAGTSTLELQGPVGSNLIKWTFQQHDPYSYYGIYFGSTLSLDSFYTGSSGYTAGAYVEPDWFAIQDAFLEACDRFMPMNTLLGETLIEYQGLTDLIKIALNPSRALSTFIKIVKSIGMEKHNLGRIATTLKHASNGTLLYSFGVRPAVEDVKGIMSAHRKVRGHFSWLINNGGNFVPVRVRKVFPSSISNPALPTSNQQSQTLTKRCKAKEVIANAGAWGRVREELNYNEIWKAYVNYFGLNKVVGLAWELIPFSFVVDWFTNVQERINYLTRSTVGSPYTEFRGICYSRLRRTDETVYFVPGYNQTLGVRVVSPASAVPLFDIEKRSYERYLTIPETSGVVDMSTLGPVHAILGGALLIQRTLR